MEPFGLGHVVNERFALEVRKVHGKKQLGAARRRGAARFGARFGTLPLVLWSVLEEKCVGSVT